MRRSAPASRTCPADARNGCAILFSAFGFDLTALAKEQLGMDLLWAGEGLPEYNVAIAAF
ncbi:MAG: hypothetical protein ACLSAF_09405 [Intestinimonas sp.]